MVYCCGVLTVCYGIMLWSSYRLLWYIAVEFLPFIMVYCCGVLTVCYGIMLWSSYRLFWYNAVEFLSFVMVYYCGVLTVCYDIMLWSSYRLLWYNAVEFLPLLHFVQGFNRRCKCCSSSLPNRGFIFLLCVYGVHPINMYARGRHCHCALRL